MSKASEYANQIQMAYVERGKVQQVIESVTGNRPMFWLEVGGLERRFSVNDCGQLVLSHPNCADSVANPDEALRLAEWLINTFGED